MVAWELEDKRGYLFQDGTLRVIASPYYSQFKLSRVDAAPLVRFFQHHLTQLDLDTGSGASSRSVTAPASVEEQAQLFLAEYRGGFAGEAWRSHQRGSGAKRRLKRHRDAVIVDVQRELAVDRLAAATDLVAQQAVWRDLCKTLKQTDLVAVREIRQLEERLPRLDAGLTESLSDLLKTQVQDAEFDARFTHYVKALTALLGGITPSWSLVTSVLALWDPIHHVCVHPTSLAQQASGLQEPALRSKKPVAADYSRALRITHKVREALLGLGLSPVDLLDVHDFMRATTSPAARKSLEALRATPVVSNPPRSDVFAAETEVSSDQAAA